MKAQHKTRAPSRQRKSKLGGASASKPKPAKEIKKRNKTNDVLTEHQHFLQKILDAEPGVVYIYDLEEHRNVYVNRHWLVAFGYTEEETKAMGSELLERICHPDDLQRIFVHHENWQQASQSDIREFEYRVQTKAGEWRWLYSREAAFLLNKVGMVKQILGIAHDITEHKQAEDAIRQSEIEYRALIDTMQEGLGVQNRDGIITFMNRRGCEMFGYTLEELVGKPVTFLFDEENQIILRDQMARRRRGEHQSYEITWLRKDGRKVDTLLAPSPRFDKEGNLVESVAVFTDITALKRAEEELRASENRYALASKATNDVIWEWNLETDQLAWHENAFTMFGYTPEDFSPHLSWWEDHVHPQDRGRVLPKLNAMIESSGLTWTDEYRFLRRDGSYAHIVDRGHIERDADGKPLRMIGAMSDITERKWSEEILRESQEQYRSLFEDSPISLWLEDFSEVKRRLDQLKENGVVDLATYLREHPGFVIECVQSIRILDVNSATLKLYHAREKSELLGSLSQMLSSVPPDQFEYELIQIANRQFNFEREVIDQTLTGENIYVNVRWSVVHGYEDTLAKVIVSTVDITERKQAEAALQETTRRLEKAQHIAHLGFLDWNLKTNDIFMSEEGYRIHGLGPKEGAITSEFVLNAVQPDEVQYVRRNLEEAIQGIKKYDIDHRIVRTDGEIVWVHAQAELARDSNGNPQSLLGTILDITERKQAEEKLRESEARFRAMADFSPLGVFLTAPDGFRLYANAQNLNQMGLTEEEARGTGWQRAIHPDDQGIVFARFGDALRQGTAYRGINRYLQADGTVVWVDVNAAPIHDGDRIIGYVGTAADITERKQAEEDVRRHINYLTALREIDQVITSTFDVQISLNTLISRAVSLLGVDAATILLIDPFTNSLKSAAGYGFRSIEVYTAHVKLGESYAGRAVIERQMIQIPDLTNEPNNLFLTGFLKGEDFVSYYGIPLIVKGETIGVLEVFQRTFIDRNQEWFNFLTTLAGQAAIAIDHATLFENLKSSSRRLSQAYDATIEGWSRAMDLRDKETEGHTQRVTDVTVKLAIAMNIDERDIVHIRRGALLHDIGKLGVPDHILLKSDKLTDEEWLIMRQHPVYAYNMLASVDYLHHALEIPYAHHEKWDGSGYPRGLKGLEIPLAARIFAVADVWDAITSDRPYRKGWPKENALEYIKAESGKYFDPQVVNMFLKIVGTSTSDISS